MGLCLSLSLSPKYQNRSIHIVCTFLALLWREWSKRKDEVFMSFLSLSLPLLSRKRPKTYPRLHMCPWLSLFISKIMETESLKFHVDLWLFWDGVDQIIRWTVWGVFCLSLSSFSKGPKTELEPLMCPRFSLHLKIIRIATNMPCADLALLSRGWPKDDDKGFMCFCLSLSSVAQISNHRCRAFVYSLLFASGTTKIHIERLDVSSLFLRND